MPARPLSFETTAAFGMLSPVACPAPAPAAAWRAVFAKEPSAGALTSVPRSSSVPVAASAVGTVTAATPSPAPETDLAALPPARQSAPAPAHPLPPASPALAPAPLWVPASWQRPPEHAGHPYWQPQASAASALPSHGRGWYLVVARHFPKTRMASRPPSGPPHRLLHSAAPAAARLRGASRPWPCGAPPGLAAASASCASRNRPPPPPARAATPVRSRSGAPVLQWQHHAPVPEPGPAAVPAGIPAPSLAPAPVRAPPARAAVAA